MLPDAYFIDQRISVSLHDIKHRVQFQKIPEHSVQMQIIEIPHDRCYPHPNLKHDIDDLAEVTEKYNRRTCHVGNRQDQRKNAEAVINQLQCIQTRRISHKCIDHQYDNDKKAMYKHC